MSGLTDWFASPAPDAALEIGPGRVSAAVVSWRGGVPTVAAYGSEALPEGAVAPSLAGTNVPDRQAVASAVIRLFGRLSIKPARVALVVPDSVAKVSLVRFDSVPARADDLAQLVRWHQRKAMPFPIEEAAIAFVPGASTGGNGREFVVTVARRAAIEEYEAVCAAAGAHAGLVDLATVSLVNLCLGSTPAPAGDWLLVHVRPDSTSLVIMRGADVAFFRTRPEGEQESLADLVQQTSMYYQDRLGGERFAHVLVAGASLTDAGRRAIEERVGGAVEVVDPARGARLVDRISVSPEVADALGPLVGMSLRAGTREGTS